MKKNIHIEIYFISICLLIFVGCKEDTGTIGLGIQSEDEFLNTDTHNSTLVVAYSASHDSLVTSEVSTNMLGYLNDPVFGKTQAGIYTQFRLSSLDADFGENPEVDSIVLTLVYAGYYGDTLNSFKLNVYELDEEIKKNERYYTTSSLKYNIGENLTEDPNCSISPRPTTRPDTSVSVYYISINLKKEFADKKFISQSKRSVYASDANFLDYFKGLYLEASEPTGNGCMLSINMTNSSSKLSIYYSNSKSKNLKYSFNMNDSTTHFGVFNHFDYVDASPNLREQLKDTTSASTKEILYAQAGAGIKIVLHFPYLKKEFDSLKKFDSQKVIIHRAKLVISQKDDALANYYPPNALNIYTNPLAGYFLPDYFLGTDYFGGKYNQEKKEYSFNITRYVQELIDGSGDDYMLNLSVSPWVTHFSRLIIYGTQPTDDISKRLQLKINYTIVN